MTLKVMCPICYEDSVQPIMQDVQFAACIGEHSHSVNDFVAFSCLNGHVFLLMSHYADPAKVEAGTLMVM